MVTGQGRPQQLGSGEQCVCGVTHIQHQPTPFDAKEAAAATSAAPRCRRPADRAGGPGLPAIPAAAGFGAAPSAADTWQGRPLHSAQWRPAAPPQLPQRPGQEEVAAGEGGHHYPQHPGKRILLIWYWAQY